VVSQSVSELRKKVAFYERHAQRASTDLERRYWLRIANHWRSLAAASQEEVDDQLN
jgi:hypothetical protein